MNRRTTNGATRDSRLWGPNYWFVLHTSAVTYPENPTYPERQAMKHYIEAVPMTLPCDICKKHAIKYLSTMWSKNMDWVVASRTNLFVFWWKFHNHVNESLGKPQMSFDKVKEMYGF
jgi:hypothetical protein